MTADIPAWLLAFAVPFSLAIGGFLARSFAGRNIFQSSNSEQRNEVILMYEKRIEGLEKRVEELEEEVRYLMAENRILVKGQK